MKLEEGENICGVLTFIFAWVEICVLPAVSVASEVAHPHIIAMISKDEPK